METADGFIDAVENGAVAHIVVVGHLDLTGLPPVDSTTLAVARPLPSLKSIKVPLLAATPPLAAILLRGRPTTQRCTNIVIPARLGSVHGSAAAHAAAGSASDTTS